MMAGRSTSASSAAGTADDPVCLLDSDSDSDDDDCQIVPSDDNGKSSSSSSSRDNGDASNTVRGTAARRKRPASASASASASAGPSSASTAGNGNVANDRFAPFRMYTTSNDLRPGSSNRPPFASTLRETIGLDDDRSVNRIHLGSMKFLCIFNYLIDFDFLLDELPELLSLDRTLVYYGSATNPTGPSQWQSLSGSNLSTIRLVPSDPPSSATNPLPFRMDWGVHHTKLFLVGYEGGLRVVVHTANLRASDLADNAQTAYVQDFPVKTKFGQSGGGDGHNNNGDIDIDQSRMVREHCDDDDRCALSSPFEEELIRYLDTYRQTTRYVWPLGHAGGGSGASGAQSKSATVAVPLLLTEVLRRYDFSSAYGVLVPSVPGWHRLRGCPWGHLRLREAIRAHTSATCTNGDGNDDDDDGNDENASTSSSTGNILLQFSSLGSISLRWLHELASSMDVRAARKPLRRLPSGAQSSSALLEKIQIVWPTFEEVRTAAAGYAAGGPIPGRVQNTDKPFLRRFYHRWSSTEDPMRKRRHPGHCKTFLQLGGSDGDGEGGGDGSTPTTTVEWCLVTSHNLSTAALGQIQNNRRMGEQCLFIRHWELGVFVSPDTLKGAVAMTGGSAPPPTAKKLKSEEEAGGGDGIRAGTDTDTAEGSKVRMVPFRGVDATYADGDVILPLPFDVKPSRYSSRDVPWATDRHGGLPDAFGRVLG